MRPALVCDGRVRLVCRAGWGERALYRLLDEASWATQGCAPLFRSAITFSARRALAAGIRRSTCSAAEAVYFERRDDQPAPDPARCFDCPVDPALAAQSSGLRTLVCSWLR